ncbi:PilZ domain-containing protein [Sphingomonas sp.]|uniref:PilZ domain-containing protein n=1 Tax=Sphingomonas sp. TaxID=28214 RepID=UPI0025EFC4C8|nr:PilZ domain-containing protein [Sphingomonas sp.]
MQKRRETRLVVNLICRIRQDDGWHDARIRNISCRGIGALSATPPAIGQYAELRRGSAVIVARVVWQHGNSSGLRSQDKIDIQALLGQSGAAKEGPFEPTSTERRRQPREDSLVNAMERSRHRSSIFQYAMLGVASLAAALFASSMVRDVFSAPLTAVARALPGASGDLP